MIKCIATDMDGTLLNSDQEVSPLNKRAIEAAREEGIEFLVVTGRAYSEVRFALDGAGIDCPAICVNGGEIRDAEGNITYSIGMNGATSEKIRKVLDKADIYFELYTHKGTYTTDYERGIESIADVFHSANPSADIDKLRQEAKERFDRRVIRLVDDYDAIFSAEGCKVYKFLAFSLDDALLEEVSTRLKTIDGIEVTSSGRHNLEITHIEAQKGIALGKYVEELGISLEDTMAFGDNYNDLSMLELAGHSYAMGNAEPEVKAAARHVTDLNDEDGVGKAILKALGKSE